MAKTALITGITGQDGAYLAKLLLSYGYRVVGGVRRSSTDALARLKWLGIAGEVELLDFDLTEITNIMRVLERTRPDEVYNLAAQSFVGTSFEQPIYTANVDAMGPLRLLEGIRTIVPSCRFYQASTSEMFGKVQRIPQDESTPFYPRSPYGCAKLFSHWITINYRESHQLFACSGILFNHESPLRGREFVTRKITYSLARVAQGSLNVIDLGNLDAKRDWGFAGDYVQGMWRMLQQPSPDDYVLATGETHTVREFVEVAAECFGFSIVWSGAGVDEVGTDARTGQVIIKVNPAFFRPAEVDLLIGSASKAQQTLDWKPIITFKNLVAQMAEADKKRMLEDDGI